MSSLLVWKWLEGHPGPVAITVDRRRAKVVIPDRWTGAPNGIPFERTTLLQACYSAMHYEDTMRLLTQDDAEERAIQTQRATNKQRLQRDAEAHVAKAFDVQVQPKQA